MNFKLDEEWVAAFGHPPDSAAEKSFYATMQKVMSGGQLAGDALKIMLQNGARDILNQQKASAQWPDGQHLEPQPVNANLGIETFPVEGGYGFRVVSIEIFQRREQAKQAAQKLLGLT